MTIFDKKYGYAFLVLVFFSSLEIENTDFQEWCIIIGSAIYKCLNIKICFSYWFIARLSFP